MTPEIWYYIGKITLYTLIAFGLGALVVFAVKRMWYWFAAIGGCFASVIGAEIVSFIALDKSISTQYGEWIKADPLWALIGGVCFSLAMISLVLHIVAYGFKKKPK